MFCDGCGNAVQSGQAFCGRCGKQLAGPALSAGNSMSPARGRVREHLHLLGILWLAMSAFNLVSGTIVYVVAHTLFGHMHQLGSPEAPTSFLRPLLTVIAMLILAKALFGFFTGWGLMQRAAWSRIAAIVLAMISLLNIPFGTAIGVYTLWVLLPLRSQDEFNGLAVREAA